jgi:hypothetical protein
MSESQFEVPAVAIRQQCNHLRAQSKKRSIKSSALLLDIPLPYFRVRANCF